MFSENLRFSKGVVSWRAVNGDVGAVWKEVNALSCHAIHERPHPGLVAGADMGDEGHPGVYFHCCQMTLFFLASARLHSDLSVEEKVELRNFLKAFGWRILVLCIYHSTMGEIGPRIYARKVFMWLSLKNLKLAVSILL
jgi:hypothetical protein